MRRDTTRIARTILEKYSKNSSFVSILIHFQNFVQSSVSHDPSEIFLSNWFGAQETLSIVEKNALLNIFVETMIQFSRFFD